MSPTFQALYLDRHKDGIRPSPACTPTRGAFALFVSEGVLFRSLKIRHHEFDEPAKWLDVSRPTLLRWMKGETIPSQLVQDIVHKKVYGWVVQRFG